VTALQDQEARDRILGDLGSTLVVEAAAGTGKTSALVGRIVQLVRSGRARLDGVLSVTFTDKAAGEMKLRLRGELEKARDGAGGEERVEKLEVAQIATIHSVCADLLRERPVAARIDPLFEVAAGDTEQRLYAQVFEQWYQREVAAPGEGVRRLLRRKPRGRDGETAREALQRAGRDLIERRDFDAPWKSVPFDRGGELASLVLQLEELGAYAPRCLDPDDFLRRALLDVHQFVLDLRRREQVGGRDPDGLEAELHALLRDVKWHWTGRGKIFAKDLPRAEVAQKRDEVKGLLQQFVERSEGQLAALLREELRGLVAAYEAAKARAGALDFLDLQLRARDLVRGDRAVREGLQARYSHVLVDEFQDTDPLQAELLLLLSADDPGEADWQRVRPVPGKLFVVGDPKQSIYRFRRADIAIYQAVKEQLVAAGASVLHLSTSFRADPALQEAINAAFAPLMVEGPDKSQAQYVPLHPHRPAEQTRPALIALPAPKVHSDWGKVVKWAVEESLPEAVAGLVAWLCNESGWTVSERESGQPVPIAPRHVCLLFKRLQGYAGDVSGPYARALEARQLPHVLVGGRSFHEKAEVLAARNGLCAIEWPDDELHVFATLRGPLFAHPDDALLAARTQLGCLFPLRRFDEAALKAASPEVQAVAGSLQLLGRLHRRRNRRPLAQTVWELFDAVRAHAGVALGQAGEQALGNLLRVVDLARRFEASQPASFRAFVERLEEERERGGESEAPVVEEGTEGVRMMTVHKAKGLEFPVVVLCDPTATAAFKNPSRYVEPSQRLWCMPLANCCPVELSERRAELLKRDADEAVRLAYVAATRARDLLVVPVAGFERIEGWLSPLDPVVYPHEQSERRPAPAPGCPAFGRESVVLFPPKLEATTGSIPPGMHRPRAGSHSVTWWDPRPLVEGLPDAPPGVRRSMLLVEDGSASSAQVAQRHEAWAAARALALESGARPSEVVVTATALAQARAEAAEAGAGPSAKLVALEAVDGRAAGRPAGARFGTLVHAILAEVALGSGAEASRLSCERLAAVHARALGATPEEEKAAALAAAAALGHPLLLRAAKSADCRRETELFHRLPDGTLLEGVVDLAFAEIEAGGATAWTVVDFKTDAAPGAEPKYREQLSLYAAAIAAATGCAARAVILAV
jgi:ATP-dependent helicase/nuclease subunit A